MKKQHTIKLFGVDEAGDRVNAQQAAKVVAFVDADNKVRVDNINKHDVALTTSKGKYTLKVGKRTSLYRGVYQGICQDTKVHFSKQKIVAKLMYWA